MLKAVRCINYLKSTEPFALRIRMIMYLPGNLIFGFCGLLLTSIAPSLLQAKPCHTPLATWFGWERGSLVGMNAGGGGQLPGELLCVPGATQVSLHKQSMSQRGL